MYDGNGNGNNYSGGGNYNGGSYANVGGFRIKPVYLYIGLGVIILLAIYMVMRFFNTHIIIHFGMVAGALLLLANVRELIGMAHAQRGSTALLNCLIAGALICAWLSQIVNVLFWIPAIALIGVAAPLVFGRSSVYTSYVQTARSAVSGVRRAVGR